MSTLPLNDVLQRITETQPPLSASTSILLGFGALAVVAIPATWSIARHWDVMAHEGSHAFFGAILGMKVDYVRLNKDATGLTMLRGPGTDSFLRLSAISDQASSALPPRS